MGMPSAVDRSASFTTVAKSLSFQAYTAMCAFTQHT